MLWIQVNDFANDTKAYYMSVYISNTNISLQSCRIRNLSTGLLSYDLYELEARPSAAKTIWYLHSAMDDLKPRRLSFFYWKGIKSKR